MSSVDGLTLRQGRGRMVKWTVMVTEPGLKVITPVYCPGSSPPTNTPILTSVLPPGLSEPLVGSVPSHGASEDADQSPAPHVSPL